MSGRKNRGKLRSRFLKNVPVTAFSMSSITSHVASFLNRPGSLYAICRALEPLVHGDGVGAVLQLENSSVQGYETAVSECLTNYKLVF